MKKIQFLLLVAGLLILGGLIAQVAKAAPPELPTGATEVCVALANTALHYAEARDANVPRYKMEEALDQIEDVSVPLRSWARITLRNVYKQENITPSQMGDLIYDDCMKGDTPSP